MNPHSESFTSTQSTASPLKVTWLIRLFHGAFLVAASLVWVQTVFPITGLGKSDWPEALLILTTTTSLLASLSRQLPFQNVFLGAIVIGLTGGVAQTIGILSGFPFASPAYTGEAGPRIFGVLPWAIPFIWVIAILASRGLARLILTSWRSTPFYGFWMMGLTALLSLMLDLGLEPFATRVHHYWMWRHPKDSFTWYGTPPANFVTWFLTSLAISALCTPLLINKKPVTPQPEYQPLIVGILLNLLFATGAFMRQLWMAAGFSVLAVVLVTILAVRGAWRPCREYPMANPINKQPPQ
jgi:uncharacterized membrane protein